MKKLIIGSLVLISIFVIIIVGNSKKQTITTSSIQQQSITSNPTTELSSSPTLEPTPTVEPTPDLKDIDFFEARKHLEWYLSTASFLLEIDLASKADVSSASHLTISTIEGIGQTSEYRRFYGTYDFADGYTGQMFRCYGKFYGYDVYGKLKGIYTFSVVATVWANYSVDFDNYSVNK